METYFFGSVLAIIRIADVIGLSVELDRRNALLFVVGILDRVVSTLELGEEIANKKPARRSELEKVIQRFQPI